MSNTIYAETLAPFHILFACPQCHTVRQVPEQYVGQTGHCNSCGSDVTIQASELPPAPTSPHPKAWYRERMRYLEYCRDNYERARAEYPPVANDLYWQRQIQAAAQCGDRLEQVARWELLVAQGIPWAVAYEYLVHQCIKDHDYERAFYFCSVYFHGDAWRNPQCAGSSHKLLKMMRKLDKKLHPGFEG